MTTSSVARALICSLLLAACAADAPPPTALPPSATMSPTHDPPELGSRAQILGPEASPVDFERIARFPEPGWQTPRSVTFSPDGRLVTYLQSESGSEEMALFAFDLASRTSRVMLRASDMVKSDKPLSREEELRRERRRSRIAGVTDYRWAKRAPVMILPHAGELFYRDAVGAVSQLTSGSGPVIDPKLCDDGSQVAFVKNGELALLDVHTRKETALTHAPTDGAHGQQGVTRGLSDYIGQEEFDEDSGFWWSPTCDRIAYLEVDEHSVDVVPVMGYRESKPDLMEQRYPRAGTKNPSVRAGILDLKSKKTTWITLPGGGEHYLGRFQWSPDGRALWFQALSRDQHRLSVLRVDMASHDGAAAGVAHEMWSLTSPTWVEFVKLRLLEKSPRVVATTPVDGHQHLEVRDAASGERVALLTKGDWDVESIAGLDEAGGRVLFTGTLAAPLERRLHAVPLSGGAVETLTPERGVHAISLSRDGKSFVDEHSASDRLPRAVVRGEGGAELGELPVPKDPDVERLELRSPEIIPVKSPGGPTLYGALLKPRHLEPGRRYPVVLMVYGGPGVQTVLDAWGPRLLWQHLADRGFVVFQLDNRGSTGRGPAFQAPIYHHLGKVELEDQLAGLDALAAMPFVDPTRVAIYGHSYGGFMAALAMLAAPDRFKVGIAGAPVTDWRLYDTGYTERYMGTPADNAAGYAESDLAPLAGNLKGKLFLLHALMDENVHFDNTAHLVDALVGASKRFDFFVFPGERHGYRNPAARRYAMRRVVDYLVENL
jgi:dipeptidyl-peptidase 4